MPDETFRWVVAGGVAIATLSICAMALVMMVLLRVVSRLQARLDSIADHAEPVVDSVRFLLNDNVSKVGEIMTAAQVAAVNARDISGIAKDQALRFAEVGRDLAERTKAQVARVDAAVDETVVQVQNLGDNMKQAVQKPIHEVSGVLAGIRAGLASFSRSRRPSVAKATQDEEMFI